MASPSYKYLQSRKTPLQRVAIVIKSLGKSPFGRLLF